MTNTFFYQIHKRKNNKFVKIFYMRYNNLIIESSYEDHTYSERINDKSIKNKNFYFKLIDLMKRDK